jgi:hypothetical protein
MIFVRILTVASLATLSACSTLGYMREVPLAYAEVYVRPNGSAELRILSTVTGRGNPHSLFEYRKYEYVSSHWVQLSSRDGEIAVSGLASACPANYTSYSSLTSVRGNVKVENDVIFLNLEARPTYQSEEGDWRRFEFNGTYKLERRVWPYVPNSKEPCRHQPMR